MGKNNKKNKRKNSAKLTGNQGKTIASVSADDIQMTGVTEETAASSSRTPESDLVDEAIKGLVDAIIECKKVEFGLREMTNSQRQELNETVTQNIFTLNALNYNLNRLLSDKDPNFVEHVAKYITLQSELKFLKDNVSTAKEMETILRSAPDKIEKSIELNDSNDQVTIETSELQYGPNRKILDSRTDENIGNGKKSTRVTHETLNSQKITKDIPLPKHSSKMQRVDYPQNKYGTFDSPQPDLEEVLLSLDSKLDKYEKKRRSVELAVKLWKEKQASISIEKENSAAILKSEIDDTTKEAEKANDLIQELKLDNIEKKDKKMDDKSNDEIQGSKYSVESASKEKTDLKDKPEDSQTAQHSKNIVTEGKKDMVRTSRENIDTLSVETDEWKNYSAGVSKKATDQVIDLIKELEAVEIGENVKHDSRKSTDKNRATKHSPGNERERNPEKKKMNRGTVEAVLSPKNALENKMEEKTDLSTSTGDIQPAMLSPKNLPQDKKGKLTDCSKPMGDIQVEDKLMDTVLNIVTDTTTQRYDIGQQIREKDFLEKKKQIPKSTKDIRRDLKKFLMLQNLKLDKQMKECGLYDSQPKFLREPDLSTNKDDAASENNKQFDTRRPQKLEPIFLKESNFSKKKDDATPENKKQFDKRAKKTEPGFTEVKQDLIMESDETIHILFDFNLNNRHVRVGNIEDFYSREDKVEYSFEFKEQKAKVSFTGDHLFVSTENSEFDIFFRGVEPADFKDDTTQTVAEP